ncbi:BPTD_2524 family lipoprotein [Bordetella genomosp. 9]|uniref:Lipoprotein n=1 Tax=Bordetella genomosp. 9 TaxID=1416803 RepID=A0A1W6Z1K9_9BORD|nr:hypothetical protein [Bordetella genomosp. 9]ARP87074.1 hypothetical protein CAL13_13285 [Bordetella genomosp. 9]ARP91061.1 hypothetical protein CAL14_12810 [Bordetella genomosp. 9]
MFRRFAAAAILASGLAGCTFGIASGRQSPSGDYKLAVNYQAAYKVARAQAEECLTGRDAYRVVGNLDTVGRKAQVKVLAPFTDNDIARVDMTAIDDGNTDVHIAMWGEGIWNADAVIAMRDAIQFQIPACVSYMPTDAERAARSRR